MESKTKDTLVYKTIIKDDEDFGHESSFECSSTSSEEDYFVEEERKLDLNQLDVQM